MLALTLSRLRRDHQVLGAILRVLEFQFPYISHADRSDLLLTHGLLAFLNGYALHAHHEAEGNILDEFPGSHRPAEASKHQINQARRELNHLGPWLQEQIELLLDARAVDHDHLETSASAYIDTYRDLIRLEEMELFQGVATELGIPKFRILVAPSRLLAQAISLEDGSIVRKLDSGVPPDASNDEAMYQ